MKSFYQVIIVGLVFSILFIFGIQNRLFASGTKTAALQDKSPRFALNGINPAAA